MMKKVVLAMFMLTSCTKPSLERNAEQWREIQELQEEEQTLLEKRDQQLAEIEGLKEALLQSATNHYESSRDHIETADDIQRQIEQLLAEGRDTSELEARRQRSLEKAEEAFQAGLDAEYFAMHEEERVREIQLEE